MRPGRSRSGSPSQSGGVSQTNARMAIDPQIVGQRRALVGPEERAVEEAARARPWSGMRQAVQSRDTCNRSGSRTVRIDSTQDHPQHGRHAVRERADHEQHDALGPLHEADLALLDQRLGARARVARHDREDQRQRRDHHVVAAAELRVQEDQPGQQREIGKAIERRVPERAELATAAAVRARPCRR